MGFYLNSAGAHEMFCDDCAGTYYVDKSAILNDLVPIVEMGENLAVAAGGNGKKSIKYTCITRPRRFGKTMMANMISAYFGRGADSSNQFAHHTISPLNSYNHEAELASMLRWIYLSAIETYRIEREDRAGTGYVNYIFYPFRRDDDALIIELKVDHTADEAIEQIKDRQYVLRFMGKPGQKPEYTGRVLAVGIAYHRKDTAKRHECRVEVLRDKISS